MKAQPAVWGLSVALFISGAALIGRAASFSAELVNTERGETHTSAFQFHDKSYRYEVIADGAATVIVKDGASGVTRILRPSEKLYLEAGPGDPMSRMADPFTFYAYYAASKEVRAEGTELIDGVSCTKQVVSSGEQVFVVAWISEEFAFPLKVEIPLFQNTVELQHINRGPVDPALFALPADYTLAPPPEEFRQPAWAGQVAAAPEAVAPFQRTLDAGNMLRVLPKSGQHLRLEVTDSRAEPCTFTAVAFKGGRALSNPSYETVTLETEQTVTMTQSKGPSEADYIVLRTSAGTASIKATFVAPDAPATGVPAASGASDVEAQVEAPDSADIATRIEVTWSGPGANDDYITVARPNQPGGGYVSMTRIREGNPVKIWTPSDPGNYEVRYILGHGAKVMTRRAITIKAVAASVAAAGPVKVADWIEVTWDGPAGEGDYVSVARSDQPPGATLALTRVKDGNPVRLRAPSDPGEYEVRYILARGTKLLARGPITVEAVTATIEAPSAATAGVDFEVRWTGPGYPEDIITVARLNQPPAANVGLKPTRQGNPLKLKAPKEPGVYEVRYILGRGSRLLAKTTITITAP